ncbi:ribosomal protein L7/L12 [Arcanobacterium wilhelmae]|uniref:Ribosomal protein L7/L12 n=1 Tax=Arcanobacterium wilhelmae TaxID=1803177 RepID=A0ABT9NA87_9ACTO|nr:50S ribosomal protein L7/L12 [Arcanobacterium wilhelmae]MDP9800136.1 ribosomal protein L7/L12 [Arcanobacterium wilhelmae]WFN89577.1 50S ribosomal protein L7/L12 [Arcanobacterium wilhelmae]
MGKWFDQAREIERLRAEVVRQREAIERLLVQMNKAGMRPEKDPYAVTTQERALAMQGRQVEAIKAYRVRTGADLVTAKKAIDSVP